MNWELLAQMIMGLIAIGSFVGQTRHALIVFTKRLDKLDAAWYNFGERLAAIENQLRRFNHAQEKTTSQ